MRKLVGLLGTLAILAMLGVGVGGAVLGAFLSRPVEEPRIVYVVVKGDTLGAIAKAHGVTVDDLRAWNGLTGDLIEVGQELTILPRGASGVPVATAGKKRPRARSDAGGGTSEAPKLSMPPEKPCLAGPSADGLADEGMVGSAGLDEDAIRASMSGFVHHTLACFGEGTSSPTTALDLEITVACTGRVSDVRVVDAGDWSQDLRRCVTDTLRYAPFPAHDLPDGETFRYPLRFTPG